LLGDFEISACRSEDFKLIETLGYKVTGTVEGAGGILLSTGDGRVLDLRFDTLVDEMRPRIREIIMNEIAEEADA
jgi:vacuolar-type H+-ATPase subunit E/Vma4